MEEDFALPPDCPYSIRHLHRDVRSSTWVIREKDNYGEYPNIFVKLFFTESSHHPSDIFLSDTGTGLNTRNPKAGQKVVQTIDNHPRLRLLPGKWNIASTLHLTLNPYHLAPYTILTTHCHYDHICGISHLLDLKNADVRVFMSSHNKTFLTPWNNLQKNSLCGAIGIQAPRYEINWVEHGQIISGRETSMSIKVLHTPGHTPDSISWYDQTTHTISVGDMLYEKASRESRSGSHGRWLPEPSMPVEFNNASNLEDWLASMKSLLDFVKVENDRLRAVTLNEAHPSLDQQNGYGHTIAFNELAPDDDYDDWCMIDTSLSATIPRVQLCAAHVTVQTDAELALRAMLSFMQRVRLDQVPRKRIDSHSDENTWLWDDEISMEQAVHAPDGERSQSRFSVQAPWTVIHQSPS